MRLTMMNAMPQKWGVEENLKVLHELLGRAAACKADLFVTPECWVDGYAAADEQSSPARLREVAQDPASSSVLAGAASFAAEHRIGIYLGFTSLEHGSV